MVRGQSCRVSWVVLMVLFVPSVGWGQSDQTKGGSSFSEFRDITKFVSIEVQTAGSAEKIGLKPAALTDVARSAFRSSFNGLPFEDVTVRSLEGTERPNQLGFLTCDVWTVGEEFVVAYHVDCNAGHYLSNKVLGTVWNHALLGYGPKDQIPDTIQRGLRNLIQKLAATFFKARGEASRQ